jgi:hypothetical protein
MKIQQGWIQIELIKKSQFTSEFIHGKATIAGGFVYFSGQPVIADDKYFIKEEQVIAYE